MWIWPSRRNFPEFQMGFWDLMWLVISSAHNLTVIQTVRRKLHTTLNNICTVLTSTWIEPELPESLNIQFVMSTFPLYQRGSQWSSKSPLNFPLNHCIFILFRWFYSSQNFFQILLKKFHKNLSRSKSGRCLSICVFSFSPHQKPFNIHVT